MSENETNPAEAALDLLLYAPLGFALEARELLPKLVERGKQQVTMARMMGQFAVQQGQTMAGDRLGQAQKQAADALIGLGLWPKPSSGVKAPPFVAEPPTTTPAVAEPARTARAAKATTATAPVDPAPPASTLAIPDYDSLSASQVVPRLEGLSASELETVRRYESAKRGRKTILGKIGQLQKR